VFYHPLGEFFVMGFNRKNILPILMVMIGLLLISSSLLLILTSSKYQYSIPVSKAQSDTIYQSHPEIRRISVENAKELYDQKKAIFIDTRGEPYYSQEHIPGAISIPEDQLFDQINELDRNYLLITYCACEAEETHARLARLLLDNGFKMVMPLQGGIDAWRESGFPLE